MATPIINAKVTRLFRNRSGTRRAECSQLQKFKGAGKHRLHRSDMVSDRYRDLRWSRRFTGFCSQLYDAAETVDRVRPKGPTTRGPGRTPSGKVGKTSNGALFVGRP